MAETLNLVNPEDKLSCKYKISKFPDGQQSITIIEDGYDTFDRLKSQNDGITIKSRLNNFEDLELIICATQALRGIGVKEINLYIPYCTGGRSDRKFTDGGVNYIKNVIAPIINLQGYNEVTILDPHSDVLEACINNFKKKDNIEIVRFGLMNYFKRNNIVISDYSKFRLVSPDAGALKKVFSVAEGIGYENEIIIAAKHRDPKTGKITHTSVPMSVNDADKDIIIIDDICDGGRTFVEIAKAINEVRKLSSSVKPEEYGKNYLIVTHGIFSNGFSELGDYFDSIYCTNSVKDVPNAGTNTTLQSINLVQKNIF
jgi:ribose-phosphate pyrophosphokinase